MGRRFTVAAATRQDSRQGRVQRGGGCEGSSGSGASRLPAACDLAATRGYLLEARRDTLCAPPAAVALISCFKTCGIGSAFTGCCTEEHKVFWACYTEQRVRRRRSCCHAPAGIRRLHSIRVYPCEALTHSAVLDG